MSATGSGAWFQVSGTLSPAWTWPLGDESVCGCVLSFTDGNQYRGLPGALGLLKAAEVSSPFEDVQNFLGAVTELSIKVISKDVTYSHFLFSLGPKAQLSA